MGGTEPVLGKTGQKQAESVEIKHGKARSKSNVPLPPSLESEIKSLREAFTVTTAMLKETVDRFGSELAQGFRERLPKYRELSP